MGGNILNIASRALLANQTALATTGNNIANVNTPGYSRQAVVFQSVPGQFTGSGYIGKGVTIETIQRLHNEFLTQQATLASSISAGDDSRLNYLKMLEDIFHGSDNGLGAAVSDMMNSFADVSVAPTDLTARTVALTRVDDLAARIRTDYNNMVDLRVGVAGELSTDVASINSLAQQIANVNEQIARAHGNGQPPNDLLDHRDKLIRDLNQFVQTTSIPADDGTVGVFIASSQPLVLGTSVSQVTLASDEYGDPAKKKLQIDHGGAPFTMDENTLGGGALSGLLRFQNSDLAEGQRLLGRLALSIGTVMNDQHKLGMDLNGNPGTDMFKMDPIPNGLASTANTGTGALQVAIQTTPTSGVPQFTVSNYEVKFTAAGTGSVTRLSDGQVTAFAAVPINIDGFTVSVTGAPVLGDRFLLTPFSAAARNLDTVFSNPKSLAAANAVVASAGTANTGTLASVGLTMRSVPAPPAVTLTFTAPGTYTRSDDPTPATPTSYTYTPGQPIEFDTTTPGATGWSLVLKGIPQAKDTYEVKPNPYFTLDSGNSDAIKALRDAKIFDGAMLIDGYAGAMANLGVRTQTAQAAAEVSGSIFTNMEQDRTSVSGVNLDEEAAKLLQYQQAYQASAKVLQVANSIFQTLAQTFS